MPYPLPVTPDLPAAAQAGDPGPSLLCGAPNRPCRAQTVAQPPQARPRAPPYGAKAKVDGRPPPGA